MTAPVKKDDEELTPLINSYVENTLGPFEVCGLLELAGQDADLSTFIQQSKQGKVALNQAYKVRAADNFEEKLARRITEERIVNSG